MLGEEAERGELAAALALPAGSWRTGWILAAMGRYGEALALLEQAMAGPDRARALGTRASVYRQLALHELAERDDDAALAATADDAVRAALLVGKVADALGLGLRDEWDERLTLGRAAVEAHGDWRQRVRLAWVAGETAMYSGDPEAAAPHFAEAVARAVEHRARRHEAKSHLFLAAAHAARDNPHAARGHGEAALALAQACGARPIVWAAALVLAEQGDDDRLALARATLTAMFGGLPADVRQAALTRSPAAWLVDGRT